MIKVIIIFQHRGKYHEKIFDISIEISPIIREDRDLPVKNSRKRTEKTGTENGEAYGHSRLMVGRISVRDMSAIPKF